MGEWGTGSATRIERQGEALYVKRLVVQPSLRSRGIGRAIMAWAEAEAARQGCVQVTIGVRIALPGSLAFSANWATSRSERARTPRLRPTDLGHDA